MLQEPRLFTPTLTWRPLRRTIANPGLLCIDGRRTAAGFGALGGVAGGARLASEVAEGLAMRLTQDAVGSYVMCYFES